MPIRHYVPGHIGNLWILMSDLLDHNLALNLTEQLVQPLQLGSHGSVNLRLQRRVNLRHLCLGLLALLKHRQHLVQLLILLGQHAGELPLLLVGLRNQFIDSLLNTV
jgi:hypothetical protein